VDIETACFRVAQEAVTNIVRYAQARCVSIALERRDDQLHLSVRDDGAGFDVAAARERAARGQSMGLLGMQERVGLLGGQMLIDSTAGRGTIIDIYLPLHESGRSVL
jgi:signal transduction histidine kinase